GGRAAPVACARARRRRAGRRRGGAGRAAGGALSRGAAPRARGARSRRDHRVRRDAARARGPRRPHTRGDRHRRQAALVRRRRRRSRLARRRGAQTAATRSERAARRAPSTEVRFPPDMANVVIVGAQWGDEGKGKVVDLYTEFADVVVRFGGGANAGHTLVVDGQKLITRLIPSGVLRGRGKRCVLGDGMVIDPKTLLEELAELRGKGLLTDDKDLLVSRSAHVVLPIYREIDRLREQGENAIGTTKRGIGPAYEAKMARR